MPGVSTPGRLGGCFLQSPQWTWQCCLPPSALRFTPDERARLSPAVPRRGLTGWGRAGHLPRAPCSFGHRRLALTTLLHPRPAWTDGSVRGPTAPQRRSRPYPAAGGDGVGTARRRGPPPLPWRSPTPRFPFISPVFRVNSCAAALRPGRRRPSPAGLGALRKR